MPLSPPVGRQHLHTRRVTCQGFFREDGLWDIEGRITDTKTYAHSNEWRGPLKPGDFVHDMSIRLTLDHRFTIVDVEAVTDKSPYQICGNVAPDFTTQDADGVAFKLSDYRGKVVVLDFWGFW